MLLGAIGFVGMTVISAVGVILGPGPTGSSIERRVVSFAPTGTAGTVLGTIALVVGLAALGGAWIGLGIVLRRGASLRPLIAITTVWATPLLFGPAIFSRDVYSYAADGLMVSRHLEPNRYGPAVLGGSHFVDQVSRVWLYTPSPYGPLFLRIAGWAVPFSHYSLFGTVLLLRLVTVVGVVLIAVAVPRSSTTLGKDPATPFWLGVCNPLVLIHFIAGAHNDSLIGRVDWWRASRFAAWKRPVAGILLCVLAASVEGAGRDGGRVHRPEAVRSAPRERRARDARPPREHRHRHVRVHRLGDGTRLDLGRRTQRPRRQPIAAHPDHLRRAFLAIPFGHGATILS